MARFMEATSYDMANFMEVTSFYNKKKVLINIGNITYIEPINNDEGIEIGTRIYFQGTDNWIAIIEKYEAIKRKIFY